MKAKVTCCGHIVKMHGGNQPCAFSNLLSMRHWFLSASLALMTSVLVCLSGCSSSYETELLRAEQMQHAGDFAGALVLYEQAIHRIPATNVGQLSAARVESGNCLLRLQRPSEAFEQYQRAADIDGNNLAARLHLAELFVAGGSADLALQHVEFVLARQPSNAGALGLLASIRAMSGDFEQARQLFEHSLEIDPSKVNNAIALAEIYNRADRVAEARKVLIQAAGIDAANPMPLLALGRLNEQERDVAGAEKAYRAAVKAGDSVLANLRLAQFLERATRIEEAEQVLRHVDALTPSSPTSAADLLLTTGNTEHASRGYLQAILKRVGNTAVPATAALPQTQIPPHLATRMIEAEIQHAPNASSSSRQSDDQAHLLRAQTLLDQYRNNLDAANIAILEAEIALARGDLSSADARSASAIDFAPASAAAFYIRGLVLIRLAKVAEAKEAWNTALDHDSDHVPSLLALANENLSEGDLNTAEDHVSSVVREEPANLTALCLYARVLLAQKRYDSAQAVVARALAINHAAIEPQLIVGEIAHARKNYAGALVAYEQVLLSQPQSTDAIHGLLKVYRHGTITREILRKMEAVAAAPPSSAALMEIAGRLYADHGWHADAARALHRALEFDAQRSSAAVALLETYQVTGNQGLAPLDAQASPAFSRVSPGATAVLAGALAQDRNQTAVAVQSYERAVQHGEASGAAANNLAWIYAQQGTKLDRALQLALSAKDNNPRNPAFLDTLGFVYLKRREYSAAVETLQRAAFLAQSSRAGSGQGGSIVEINKHLAQAYEHVGLPEKAASLSRIQ